MATPPTPPVTRLIFPLKKGFCESSSTSCHRLRRGRKCIIPETSRNLSNSDPKGGWLLMIDHDDGDDSWSELGNCCCLWNPVTLEKIELPTSLKSSLDLSQQKFGLTHCVLSCSSGNNDNSVSMVFLLFNPIIRKTNDDKVDLSSLSPLLLFCRPRRDKHWGRKKLDDGYYSIKTLITCSPPNKTTSTELYLLSYGWKIIKIDFFDDETLEEHIITTYCGKNVFIDLSSYSLSTRKKIQNIKSVGDEIFKVIIYYNHEFVHESVVEILIYKMDKSTLVWRKVTSLGDHVLFIGQNSMTASCSASHLGLKKGFVYYTMTKDKNLYKFDIENNNVLVSLSVDGCITNEQVRNVVLTMGNMSSVQEIENVFYQGQNYDEGKREGVFTFDILNEDILKSIFSYLNPIDYLHFRDVSKSIRLTIPKVNWKLSSTGTKSSYPWLVLYKKESPIYTFVNPMTNNDKYLMNLGAFGLSGASIRYSKGGWLLMSKGGRKVFFFNPFTKKTIKIPDVFDETGSTFSRMSFSSSPTSSDCVVFAISIRSYTEVNIRSIGRGQDSWCYQNIVSSKLPSAGIHKKFVTCLANLIFLDGAFYCLDSNGFLLVFRSKDAFGKWKLVKTLQRPHTSFSRCFLVECDGNLLSVFVGDLGEGIKIFRLGSSKKKWVKVESLGKYMLFISDIYCIAAIASNSSTENNVYLSRFHGERILFYSLKTGMYHSVGSRHSLKNFYNTKNQLLCSWVEPNWSNNTDEELDWFGT